MSAKIRPPPSKNPAPIGPTKLQLPNCTLGTLLVRVVELPVIAAFLPWWPLQDLGVAFVRMGIGILAPCAGSHEAHARQPRQGRLRVGQPTVRP